MIEVNFTEEVNGQEITDKLKIYIDGLIPDIHYTLEYELNLYPAGKSN